MDIRLINYDHLPQVMRIIEKAKIFLKENKIPQWQDGYPNQTTIENDISKKRSFGVFEQGELIATAALISIGDSSYDLIEGQWLTNTTTHYLTIHRVAIMADLRGKHLSQTIFELFEQVAREMDCPSIRMDTHERNTTMRHVLQKNGYSECGIIYLNDVANQEKARRIGYEKII